MKYVPHEYQRFATDFIVTHPTAAIFLDMGMGKSSITLTAIERLMYQEFEVRKVLIIAPLRVAKNTWPAEIQKWDHLNGLTWSVIIGTQQERMEALRREADIYLINRENTQWLIEKSGMPFDYDMVVIDELSSFKSWQSKRFRSLMKVRPFVRRIVGLTGTPSSNGLMDLFAAQQQRSHGSVCGIPCAGYGPAAGSLHRAVPECVFQARQDERPHRVQL